MGKEKLGIVANYLDSRNDLRDFISSLEDEFELVVFYKPAQKNVQEYFKSMEFRPIKTKVSKSLRNVFLHYWYKVFGKLPSSKSNYFITEKVANTHPALTKWKRKDLQFTLWLSRFMPKFMSYDGYLNAISYAKNTRIDDIQKFLVFTHIYDDFFYAQLLKQNKTIYTYVYSWDHPCKLKTFSKRPNKYLCWNSGLKDDLVELQKLDKNKISIAGSTQLAYIDKYLKEKPKCKVPEYPYIYFGCALGYPVMVKEEVKYIKQLSSALHSMNSKVQIIVRPYPFLALWDIYKSLEELGNVTIEEYRRSDDNGLEIDAINQKFAMLEHAEAFVHLGTTLGMECAYFDTPVLLINYGTDSKVKPTMVDIIGQYHNIKYLTLDKFPNVINDPKDWTTMLEKMFADSNDFLPYNREIAKQTELRSFKQISKEVATIINHE